MIVISRTVELMLGALRDAKKVSGTATMRAAATTAIDLTQFNVRVIFDKLVELANSICEADRDVLCVAMGCCFFSCQTRAGAHFERSSNLNV